MHIVYAKEPPPSSYSKSIFLAGPTPRDQSDPSFRPQALRILEALGYDGVVFVPEPRDGRWAGEYEDQLRWEDDCMRLADCIVFWIPRRMETMPGLTTNDEWGFWKGSGKVVLGAPVDAVSVQYQRFHAELLGVPVETSLEATLRAAIDTLAEGAERSDGEREVPLHIWRTPSFQSWYVSQRRAGNRLEGCRVVWTFRAHERRFLVFWALHVSIYVAAESRRKSNEVVLSRPDVACVLLYRRAARLDDTEIALIREFRSAAVSSDGFVRELPGGSTFADDVSAETLAVDEVGEETGLAIAAARLRRHSCRQLNATMSAHRATLFSAELSDLEMESVAERRGQSFGAGGSERTYPEIVRLGDLRRSTDVDWSTVGMILSVIGPSA